jgi:hypothetical protein
MQPPDPARGLRKPAKVEDMLGYINKTVIVGKTQEQGKKKRKAFLLRRTDLFCCGIETRKR